MRNLPMFTVVTLFALGAAALGSSKSKISQLPDGTLSGNVYSNDALGLSYEFPSGWTATADPKRPVNLDSRKPDGLVNQCSKILLSLEAPRKTEGRFTSVATLFAIDPGCFPGTEFPHSMDKGKIQKVADKIIRSFSNTPYISPDGAYVVGYWSQGRVIIHLTGGVIVNAVEGPHPATKEPLHLNISFIFTESNGYWVAWAFAADDPSAEELKNAEVALKDALSR
jgi:hypothetical protein